MPFPAHGCLTCRDRHVKCDQQRPACQRCQTSGRECKGYQLAPGGMIFRSENIYVRDRSMKRPRGGAVRNSQRFFPSPVPDSIKAPSETDEQSSEASAPVAYSIVEFTPPPLTKPVTLPVQELAFQNYVKGYVEVAPRIGNEVWLYVNTRREFEFGPSHPETALNHAAYASALVCFGNLHKSQEAIDLSQESYGKALMKLKTAFEDPDVAVKDSILCTTLMLLVYEDCFRNPAAEKFSTQSFRHWDGALTLLKIRHQRGFRSKEGQALDRNIRRRMLSMHLSPATPLPDWIQNGADFSEEQGVDLDFDGLLVDTIQLQSRILGSIDALKAESSTSSDDDDDKPSSSSSIRKLYDSINECIAVDEALKAWATSLPSEYDYTVKRHPRATSTSEKSLIYKGLLHTYKELKHARAWNRWRCTRLSLLMLQHDCLELMPQPTTDDTDAPSEIDDAFEALPARYDPTTLPSLVSIEQEIHRLLDDICASVPAYFDITSSSLPISAQKKQINATPPLQASPLIWPLNFASRAVRLVGREQRRWLIEKVRICGEMSGNALLKGVAEWKLKEDEDVQKGDGGGEEEEAKGKGMGREKGTGKARKRRDRLYGVTEARS